jgi:predicted RNA-binding Zn ribbon-like protein
MSYDDYDLNTVLLALDLASFGEGTLTLPGLLDRKRLMDDGHGYRAGAEHADMMRALGERVAGVLATPGEEEFVDALADLLEDQPCKPHLTRHDGFPHLHYAHDGAPFGEWVSALAVAGLALYVCHNGRGRLRRCAARGCGRWFADTSRNSSRRYCEHACASRTTVAAFRERQRAER